MPSLEILPSLKQLRAFTVVAEAGSALAASARLRISQPAVSYSLDRLEAVLGVELLDRNASGSYPTPAGRLLYNRAARLFAQIGEAVHNVVASEGQASDRSEALGRKLRETQVRALVSIWRTGSFQAAARDLAIAEPSLQRPARDLERLLRVSLYRRTQAGIEVNPTGAELARRFSLALGEIRCAIEEIGATALMSSASLRIGVLALSPRMLIAEAAVKLLTQRPQQRIDVIEASYESHIRALRSGDIDIIFGALHTPSLHADVIEEWLFEDPYVLVCGPSHPLARSRTVSPEQLANYDFALPSQGLPRRAVLDRMLERWGIKPKARIETSCLATILALLQCSNRISLLSRWHVDSLGSKDLRCIPVRGARFSPRFVGLATRSRWLPTPFQKDFLQLIRRSSKMSSAPIRSPRLAEAV